MFYPLSRKSIRMSINLGTDAARTWLIPWLSPQRGLQIERRLHLIRIECGLHASGLHLGFDGLDVLAERSEEALY
jgi:hypothetical protein